MPWFVHFALKIPFHHRLIPLVDKLLNIPSRHPPPSIPLREPKLNGLYAMIFRPLAFHINRVLGKNPGKLRAFSCEPQLKPILNGHFSFPHIVSPVPGRNRPISGKPFYRAEPRNHPRRCILRSRMQRRPFYQNLPEANRLTKACGPPNLKSGVFHSSRLCRKPYPHRSPLQKRLAVWEGSAVRRTAAAPPGKAFSISLPASD